MCKLCLILFFFCLGFYFPIQADILSDSDVRLYQEILDLQEIGQIKQAKIKQEQIQNPLLMGYVFYQRYFSKGYKTDKKEVLRWMKEYSDLPLATEIYALGRQKNVSNLPRPKGIFGGNTNACESFIRIEPGDMTRGLLPEKISGHNQKEANKILKKFNRHLGQGNTLNAKNLLDDYHSQKTLNKNALANARTALAFSYFLDGRDDLAQEQLKKAYKNTSHPMTNWMAGLIFWRAGDYEKASQYFITTCKKTKEDSLRATSAFWAARALVQMGRYDEVAEFLEIASSYPRYFYGVLAKRLLGQDLEHQWEEPIYADKKTKNSFSHPALDRFYALRQLGQERWAIEELTKLYLESNDETRQILWSVSKEHDFDDVLQGLTGILNGENIRYPLPDWEPQDSWQLDKALVYAFVRQESCFNHRAESSVGAMGLMQLMPSTAKEQANKLQCEYKTKHLKQPEYNLRLGQAYLKELLNLPYVQNNLIKLAVAYNAGPGNLRRWEKKMKFYDDPLLFLETIPSKETRTFVERILVNYWVYLNLMGEDLSSLDEIVAGNWPMYQMCSA
jgi:tetratricopeptide (TPR) repeat protein